MIRRPPRSTRTDTLLPTRRSSELMPAGEADRALAAQMIDYWAAFAAHGPPAADGAPAWPAYGDAENFIRFGARPVAERDIFPGMFEIQAAIMQRRRGAGAQWVTHRSPLQRHHLMDYPPPINSIRETLYQSNPRQTKPGNAN